MFQPRIRNHNGGRGVEESTYQTVLRGREPVLVLHHSARLNVFTRSEGSKLEASSCPLAPPLPRFQDAGDTAVTSNNTFIKSIAVADLNDDTHLDVRLLSSPLPITRSAVFQHSPGIPVRAPRPTTTRMLLCCTDDIISEEHSLHTLRLSLQSTQHENSTRLS